jgi:hypothetical protein
LKLGDLLALPGMEDLGQALEVVDGAEVVVIGGLDVEELEVLDVDVVGGGVVLDFVEDFALFELVVVVLEG